MKCNLPKEKQESTLSMTAYDLNKSIMTSMPILENLDDAIKLINEKMWRFDHLMLLCKDISYYTIFYKDDNQEEFPTRGDAILTCAQDVGKIITVDYMEASDTIEIWVRTAENDNLCMCLFDCAGLMVGFKGE